MYTIAVIDDREEDRILTRKLIERALRRLGVQDRWRVLVESPLSDIAHYPAWLEEEEVLVLLLDQRLNEAGGMANPYTGHDIVNLVQPRHFDLPVYYLTAIAADVKSIEQGSMRVQGVISRQRFSNDPQSWVKEFVREGERYEEKVARKLERLSILSAKAVNGGLTAEEAAEARTIREALHLPFESGNADEENRVSERVRASENFRNEIGEVEALIKRLRSLVEDDETREEGTQR